MTAAGETRGLPWLFAALAAAVAAAVALGLWSAQIPAPVGRSDSAAIPEVDGRFLDRSDLEVHYVAVRESSRDDSVVELDLRRLDRRDLVVLSSRKPVLWKVRTAPGSGPAAVILAGRKQGFPIRGLAQRTELFRLGLSDLHVTALRPHCTSYGGLEFRCDGWSADTGSPFQRLDRMLESRLGHAIASVTFAEAAASLTVPGLWLDDELRAALDVESRQIDKAYKRVARLRTNKGAFETRYKKEQQETIAALLARHSTLEAGVDAEAVTRLHIVSVAGGVADEVRLSSSERRYADFRRKKDSEIGRVTLRYTLGEPAVFVLLSHNAVSWRLETEASDDLQGVLVSSAYVSAIEDLPGTVPLTIVSPRLGDRDYLRAPYRDEDWQALERTIGRRFPNAAIHRHHHGTTSVVLLR